jgi:hypothetical protein
VRKCNNNDDEYLDAMEMKNAQSVVVKYNLSYAPDNVPVVDKMY